MDRGGKISPFAKEGKYFERKRGMGCLTHQEQNVPVVMKPPCKAVIPWKSKGRGKIGASLLETLVAMNIAVWMGWLALCSFGSITSSGQINGKVSDLQGYLEQARTHAMLLNTYVYVGFFESDGALSENFRPAPSGVGRLWVGAVATKDGTRGYDPQVPSSVLDVANLAPIGKLQRFDNMHLADEPPFRVREMITNAIRFDGTLTFSSTAFGWPVESRRSIGGFSKGVVMFDPRGSASVPGATLGAECIEIPMLPARGNLVAGSSSNAAVIQLDAVNGTVRAFRQNISSL